MTKTNLFAILILYSLVVFGAPSETPGTYNFQPGDKFSVCFTPGQNCEKFIADKIDTAKHTLEIQQYHLTNPVIIAAILRAESRKVDVEILLDKAAANEVQPFVENEMPVFIDWRPAIAHNKVIIIDDTQVITGSFNMSKNAQKRNAENAIWEQSTVLAHLYLENFKSRLALSSVVLHD